MRAIAALLLLIAALAGPASPAFGAITLPAAPAEEEPAPEQAAPLALDSPDGDIRNRLLELYREIDSLGNVGVRVRGGVVTLVGTTLAVEDRVQAEEIAARLDGVASVENRIQTEHRLDRRLAPLAKQTEEIGLRILVFLPLLLVAMLVWAAFWIAGVLFTRWTNIFRRMVSNQFVENLLEQVVRLVFILVGLVLAMNILGATALIGSVLGAAGVFGLAIGFAMRDTLENYIASILLSLRRPFAPNDAVIIEGVEGRITTLNSRATIITTWDGNEVRIPNAIVYKAKITNFTHTPQRRFDFEIRISVETDVSCALAVAMQAVKKVDGVLAEPAPSVLVNRLEDYSIVLAVFAWVDQTQSDFGKVKSEAIRAVKEAFAAEQIGIAAPAQAYRMLPMADVEPPRPQQSTRRATAAELQAIQDTSADTTIEEQVEARRKRTDNDLLTTKAPRE